MSCVSCVVVVTQHALTDWAVCLTPGFVTHTMIVLTALMKWDALVQMGESCISQHQSFSYIITGDMLDNLDSR